jgi:hypothetical protein
MKKSLIGGLVGGLIIFIWQFLSWTVLDIHGSKFSYTPAENQILQTFNNSNLEEGDYFLPGVPPGTSAEAEQKLYMDNIGKPWATISYHKSMSNNMGLNMLRAFVIDFLSAFLLCYILLGNRVLNFKIVFISCIVVGLIGFMTIPYLNSIWFESNSIPDLIDAVVQWGLVGAFLGWLLPEKKK